MQQQQRLLHGTQTKGSFEKVRLFQQVSPAYSLSWHWSTLVNHITKQRKRRTAACFLQQIVQAILFYFTIPASYLSLWKSPLAAGSTHVDPKLCQQLCQPRTEL
jgi:hypothetical protein